MDKRPKVPENHMNKTSDLPAPMMLTNRNALQYLDKNKTQKSIILGFIETKLYITAPFR